MENTEKLENTYEITKDLDSMFGKSIKIAYPTSEHSYAEIFISKNVHNGEGDYPVYAPAKATITSYPCTAKMLNELIGALEEALQHTMWLDEQYPTGSKLFKS